MDFFDFETAFEFHKRQHPKISHEEYDRQFLQQLKTRHFGEEQEAFELFRFHSERSWTELRRPYFKIWPDVIPLLSEVNVDVPAECLRLPYAVFLLRLPRTESPLVIDEHFQIRSILVTEARDVLQLKGKEVPRSVNLWIDTGERLPTGLPMLFWRRLKLPPRETIENAFNSGSERELPGVRVSNELARKCLRLAISTCFLSTGTDRLIEPDILSDDLAAYIEAKRRCNESRVQRIASRAERRRGPGWSVGQPDRLRPLFNSKSQDTSDGGTGRELTHQHQRRAHFRLIKTGQVVFIRQATVRPDLPPAGRAAYAVR